MFDALKRTPLIEELTPTHDEWMRCESVGDRYDLMKRCVDCAADLRAALEPFSRYAKAVLSRRDGAQGVPVPDDRLVFGIDGAHITIGDLRRVAALAERKDQAGGGEG